MEKHSGLIAAPFAPLHSDGSINPEIIESYYHFLERNGISGVFINGTTGEGASLTQKERQHITSAWTACSGIKKSLRIINLVGGTSYNECIENAIHSRESGVSAIAVIAPYFFKPADENHLADFVARIGVAVPDMPVYFYHIPVITGVSIPMVGFLKKISGMLPNFAGIKYTHEDFMDYLSCLDFNDGKYDLFWGRDECMLSAMAIGARAFVGSTYNYAAPLYHELIRSFKNGDLSSAKKYQQKSVNMISLNSKYGGIATGKAFMRYVGIDCGNYRSPVKNLTDEMYREFIKDVKALQMDNLFSK